MTALLLIAAVTAVANMSALAVRVVLAVHSARQRADRRHRPTAPDGRTVITVGRVAS